MKKASVTALAGLLAALGIMSLGPSPADARIDCKFDHFTNIPITERPVFKCPRGARPGPGLDERSRR